RRPDRPDGRTAATHRPASAARTRSARRGPRARRRARGRSDRPRQNTTTPCSSFRGRPRDFSPGGTFPGRGNFPGRAAHLLVMNCDIARGAIPARIDGEGPGLPDDALAAHLRTCDACRDWQERAHALTRRARLGGPFLDHDLTGTVLASAPTR